MSESMRIRSDKSSWKTVPMSMPVALACELFFTEEEYNVVSFGLIPQIMEDKWFVYLDDNSVLHLHRSWTGNEIFRAEINKSLIDGYYIDKLYFENDKAVFNMCKEEDMLSMFKVLVNGLMFNE